MLGEKEERTLYNPTQGERLGQFASSHFTISFLGVAIAGSVGFVLVMVLSAYEALLAVVILATILAMMAYVFAGARSAKICGWKRPKNAGAGVLAFLFPALIAWAWGSWVLCCISLPSRDWAEVGFLLAVVSFVVALPSSLVVYLSLGLGFLDGGLLNMIFCMLLAGGLPPLLFLLGNIWGGRKAERCTVQPSEEKEAPDGTQQSDTTA